MFIRGYRTFFLCTFFLAFTVQAEDINLDLQMPGTIFLTGSPFYLDLELTNTGQDYNDALVFVALNVGTDEYWFYPSWRTYPPHIHYKEMDIQGFNSNTMSVIQAFDWPVGTGSFFNARFIAAVVSQNGELISNVPIQSFGWTSEPIIETIEPASGSPGKLLKIIGRGFNLSSDEIRIGINGYRFPVISSGVDDDGSEYVITLIPPLDSASYDITLISGSLESNSVLLFIDEMASTGKPLGQVVTEISQGMNVLFTEINTNIIPDAVADGIIPSAAQADYEATIHRAEMIFNAFSMEIENLPDDQKLFFESAMVQNGLDEIFTELTSKSPERGTRGDLSSFYACLSLDTTSACLTAIDQAWSIVDLTTIISAILSGGISIPAVGGSFGTHYAITILDSALDGFFPVDLKEINLKGVTDALSVYVGLESEYTINGSFDNQKTPLDATFGMFLSTFLEGLGPFVPETFDDQLRNWVIGKLTPMGLSLGDSIMGGDILDWGDPSPVTLPVEFEIYETIDLNELLAMTTMSFGTQPMLKLMEHFNMTVFPETGITVRDPGKLGYELDQEKIRLTGIATGNTSITFRAFAFDVSGAWWNLFGVEVPEQVVKLQEVSVSTPPANTPTPVPVPTNFVYIPAGTFQMGAPEDEDCRQNDEVPRHSVTLTKDLYVQQAEMTRQQWAYVFGPVPPESEKNLPTCYISFYDACIYCNRISVADGFRPCYYEDESYVVMFDGTPPVYRGPVFWDQSADGYRLPTEAEWEYACRAGTLTPYNNGDENTSCAQEDPNLNPLAWYRYNSDVGRETEAHDVGLKQPNAWQLYDMHGNVFEWCWDWYETFYYESSPSVNPSGPLSGEYHVIRGGDFYSAPADCRSAGRYYQVPNAFCNDLGFRLFRSD